MELIRKTPSNGSSNLLFDDLINTKLGMPPLKPGMVERRRLLDRLAEGRDRPLIIISGVAGSGKTSLVRQWLTADRLAVAWYSLDEADNEPDVFFRYMLGTLATVDHGLASLSDRWLREETKPIGRRVVFHLLDHLLALRNDIYLVLEDYHFITSRELQDDLLYFLDHMPPRVHVVITTRHGVPPALSHFKIRDQLVEISDWDLRFMEEEAKDFFTATFPLKLTEEEIREVLRQADGWVAGLQLFGLCRKGEGLPNGGFKKALVDLGREATTYLVNEVISVQPPNVRAFLEATALLDRFNGDICREVTGAADAPEMIERISRDNLFLIPLDDERRWYRYHHLFSQAVRERARVSSPDRLARTHRLAALWFARNGYPEDAFRHAFASNDMEFAADVLEDYIMVLYERYEIASFRRWLARLPHAVFMQRTLLRLLECRLNVESVRLLEVEALLNDIESRKTEAFARYRGSKRQLCEDHLLLFKCILPFWADPVKVDPGELNDAISRISPHNMIFSGMAEIMLAASYLFQGEMPQAGRTAKEAMATVMSSESLLVKMLWFRLTAAIERWQGRLHRAGEILKSGFYLLERMEAGDTPAGYILHSAVAWVHYLHDDLDDAHDHATTALKLLEETGSVWEVIETSFLAALLCIARKEADEAVAHENRIRTISRSSGDPYMISFGSAFGAILSLAHGDIKEAELWAAERRLRPDEPFSYLFGYECLALGMLLCDKGRYEDAVALLEPFRGECRKRGMMEILREADLLLSRALYAGHHYDRARAVMEHLLALSEPEGYVRPLLSHGKGMSPLLLSMARRAAPLTRKPFVRHMMKALGLEGKARAAQPGPDGQENLTRRESEILKLLAMGYTYKEISGKACVSIDTVRTHIRHVFAKLEVRTRTQAIQRAEALGIID